MTTRRALVTAAVGLLMISGALTAQAPTPPPQTPPQPEADRFYDAVRSGDLAQVRSVLDSGIDVNLIERRGGATPLMNAAAFGSIETMKLLLDKGAKVNAASYGGMTALMWAVADLPKVRLLVERGADVNTASASGRTALHLAAMGGNSAAIVRYLLQHGANPLAIDKGNVTTVLAATTGNDTDAIRQLIDAHADVNAAVTSTDADFAGTTPLMKAAGYGNLEAVRLLLSHGAKVNAVSGPPAATVKNGTIAIGTFTPLLLASTYGPDALVKELVTAGADVNVKDARGMTPLMFAVSADHNDPAIVKTLLAAGAKTDVKSLTGETAMDWAVKSGATPRVAALKAAGAPGAVAAAVPIRSTISRAPSVRVAVEKSLRVIQPATGTFFTNGGCAACHSQNITDVAVGEARAAGVAVDEAGARERDAGAAAQFGSIATRLLERMDAPVVDIPLYTLLAFAAAHHTPDRATDALVFNVAAQQSANGAWHRGLIARPPLSDGDTSTTALGVRALAVFGPPAQKAEMTARIDRALDFLRAIKPITAEDRAYRMLGLVWGGVRPKELAAYITEAQAKQHTDGGWSQNDTLDSDAYSTSILLYALVKSGVPATERSVTKAIDYLLASQHEDGSWFVRSRAPKFQPYFDGGFPYEHDQWISSMATGWASAALAATIRPAPQQASR